MADKTAIEWTDATWNPITGCSVASPGCTNCYAMELAGTRLKSHPSRAGLTREVNGNHVWTGEVRFNEQWLDQPLRWKKPRMIFVCAHGDLFHESVPDEWIDRVFAVMALAPQHTFQVLTKRSARMRKYVTALLAKQRSILSSAGDSPIGYRTIELMAAFSQVAEPDDALTYAWKPLPNVWLGVSVEDQTRADERVPDLLATPAAVRWLSCEPLLGPVDLWNLGVPHECKHEDAYNEWDTNALVCRECEEAPYLDWIVVGGESGRNARPMRLSWVQSLRDQCSAAGVAFLMKQWGEWAPASQSVTAGGPIHEFGYDEDERCRYHRVGKKRAGRLLDGVLHDGFPGGKAA